MYDDEQIAWAEVLSEALTVALVGLACCGVVALVVSWVIR